MAKEFHRTWKYQNFTKGAMEGQSLVQMRGRDASVNPPIRISDLEIEATARFGHRQTRPYRYFNANKKTTSVLTDGFLKSFELN